MNDLNPKGPERIVCYCMGITEGEIVDAIKDGATSVEAIGDETGAGTVCGTCKRKLQLLVDEHA